jgi:DNA-binding LacI/PurR family transcriptional regulator
MGKKAAEILLNRIEKGIDKNKCKVKLPVNFIKRNSTSFPKKNIYEKK